MMALAFYGKSFRIRLRRHWTKSSTRYTEAELFWIVKYGIRNTAMPAWKSLLSDENIWQVVGAVSRFESGRAVRQQNRLVAVARGTRALPGRASFDESPSQAVSISQESNRNARTAWECTRLACSLVVRRLVGMH